jgi:hypothetical protein
MVTEYLGKDYSAVLPAAGTRQLQIQRERMSFNKISIKSGTDEVAIIPARTEWGSSRI